MLSQFFTIGILMLFSAMLPGPDFALVTKNTIVYSRRAGFFTALGIGNAVMIHITYCMLGLAVIISQSILLFNIIKYIGAVYLIYLGITSLSSKQPDITKTTARLHQHKKNISDFTAYRQGILCNLLNPKATLFFLALFTVIIKPGTYFGWEFIFGIEMVLIVTAWFFILTILLSHPYFLNFLNRIENYISKVLGAFLIGFGVALAFIKHR